MTTNPRHNLRDVYPPTGPEITAKRWVTEAPMRMLMNNLHPDVAENPTNWWSMAALAGPRAPGTTSTASSPR